MNRDEAKEIAKAKLREYYASLVDKRGVCPICGGGHNTACFHIDPHRNSEYWKCFSCNRGGDIFELYSALNGVSSGEAMEAVYKLYGIPYTDTHTHNIHTTYTQYTHKDKPAQKEYKMEQKKEATPEQIGAAENYILKAEQALEGSAGEKYLAGRGFTLPFAREFRLGYDTERRRLVIPREKGYTARAIDDGVEPRYLVDKGMGAELFHKEALEEEGQDGFSMLPVYIVEGEFDAMSIIRGAGEALALGSTSNARLLLDYARELKKKYAEFWTPTIILALDNDEAGKKASASLKAGLEKLGLEVYEEDTAKLYGGYKDANEALVKDGGGFIDRLINTPEKKESFVQSIRNQYREQESNSAYMSRFEDYILQARTAIPTGFQRLDMLLSGDEKSGDKGGLSEGLYALGAISSCGKTTFVLQLCDNIAESGRDILFFSLEMSRFELMSKSVSRLTYQLEGGEEYKALRNDYVVEGGKYERGAIAKTNYGISKGARYGQYKEAEKKLIVASEKYYEEKIAPHIFIVEGKPEGTSVQMIRDKVAEHIEKTGAEPVVVIDYLQMIAPPKDLERSTDKQIVDYNIRELKVASRTHKIPLIVISSFNRGSYTAEAAFQNFKESGSIEYSADIVMALSLAGVKKAEQSDKGKGEATAEHKQAGNRPERSIELEILKNRNGAKGSILFSFRALFNYFEEYTTEGERQKRIEFMKK
jgi:replicative DNA helicase